ncbi:hypothetical protein QVZ41_14030 [Wenyingzhuangia sp. chi5]|uniref:Uncharacterized protein n=1 Tax=Wenyingzhuangia gilva TaxID=3057677 RepID=A0ABT8VVH6_9FLAO|nr:hypothetical protein [Wenyingzhuangia sp. chi5]MDO3695966.1 hypothetical protein [Wenyingzhuangia sp. chi5]
MNIEEKLFKLNSFKQRIKPILKYNDQKEILISSFGSILNSKDGNSCSFSFNKDCSFNEDVKKSILKEFHSVYDL